MSDFAIDIILAGAIVVTIFVFTYPSPPKKNDDEEELL